MKTREHKLIELGADWAPWRWAVQTWSEGSAYGRPGEVICHRSRQFREQGKCRKVSSVGWLRGGVMKMTLTVATPNEALAAIAAEARRQSTLCNVAAQRHRSKREQDRDYTRAKTLADFAAFIDQIEVAHEKL